MDRRVLILLAGARMSLEAAASADCVKKNERLLVIARHGAREDGGRLIPIAG